MYPSQVSVFENVYWKELGLLVFVWVAFLALQIAKVSPLLNVFCYDAYTVKVLYM